MTLREDEAANGRDGSRCCSRWTSSTRWITRAVVRAPGRRRRPCSTHGDGCSAAVSLSFRGHEKIWTLYAEMRNSRRRSTCFWGGGRAPCNSNALLSLFFHVTSSYATRPCPLLRSCPSRSISDENVTSRCGARVDLLPKAVAELEVVESFCRCFSMSRALVWCTLSNMSMWSMPYLSRTAWPTPSFEPSAKCTFVLLSNVANGVSFL